MTSAPQNFTAFRFSTDDFPVRDRDEAFREIYGRAIMRVELEPPPGVPFALDMQLRALPDFGMSFGSCSQVTCLRKRELIDSDDFILVAALAGGGILRTRSKEVQFGAGEAVLTNASETGSFDVHSASKLINFRFTSRKIVPLIADLDAALMRPIPQHSETLKLLLRYAGNLQNDLALACPRLRNAVVAHVHDLTALALGATRDVAATASGRGVRAARLQAIKADIAGSVGDPDLSIAKVASRHGVTPRYIGMLFEAEAETFSEYVLRQRLIRAHRMLTDPHFSERTVSSIAYHVGFSDASYFNRTFRRQYGVTPSDVRSGSPKDQTETDEN
jgi:AraC-like DNA-binding protein